MKPSIKLPTPQPPARSMKPSIKPPPAKPTLPDKVGKRVPIKDTTGKIIFEGTEREWRAWVKKRRDSGEYIPRW